MPTVAVRVTEPAEFEAVRV
jgi:hypothetical protein